MNSNGLIIRKSLWMANRERLAELAWRALRVKKLDPTDFFLVCIDVDDSNWTDLVECLMPNHDWDSYRRRGQIPIAHGPVYRDAVGTYLSKRIPALAPSLKEPDSTGLIQVVVLAASGGSLYAIEPKMEPN